MVTVERVSVATDRKFSTDSYGSRRAPALPLHEAWLAAQPNGATVRVQRQTKQERQAAARAVRAASTSGAS
jgi:hypothetical protein